jgi:adenylate kinase family enzyme
MPYCVILAGPNGAGKSTLAPALVHDLLGIKHFVVPVGRR